MGALTVAVLAIFWGLFVAVLLSHRGITEQYLSLYRPLAVGELDPDRLGLALIPPVN
jgi:hypothetical protein